VGAGQDELGALDGPVHLQQVELHALAGAVLLRPDLLGGRKDGLRFAQVYDGLLGVDTLDNARDDIALAAGELLEEDLPLELTQALQHHLFGGLGGDTAGVPGMDLVQQDIAQHYVGLAAPGLLQADLRLRV